MAQQTLIDNKAELEAMSKFYAESYQEVYFIRDLKADVIVAVECYPAKSEYPVVTRNGRRLNCFGYKNRLLSSRERLDRTQTGKPMVGYESIFGNDTRLGLSEEGVIIKSSSLEAVEIAGGGLPASSPFEKYQLAQQIQEKQAGNSADYEIVEKDGKIIERFESFAVERIK